MNKTLVILAAGMGSRYGGGIKQIEPVGQNGEIIINYSIHDAIEAGFNKVVIVIRKDIENDFREILGYKLDELSYKHKIEYAFAFQKHPVNESDLFPAGRNKPWGTGDAVLACKNIVDGPFAVINADDYYGKEAFIKASELLQSGGYGMIGFRLGNTLSENGAVTRGICKVEAGALTDITETSNILKVNNGAESEGRQLPLDSVVSMNFWTLPLEFIDILEDGFPKFIDEMKNPMKDEYLLPEIIGELVRKGTKVKVAESGDKWFGVTYHEDKPLVVSEFQKLYDKGIYKYDLYSDLV